MFLCADFVLLREFTPDRRTGRAALGNCRILISGYFDMLLAKGGAFSSLVAQSHYAMTAVSPPESAAFAPLRALLASRIAILEGPKGTLVQARQLTEVDFRGERFRLHPHDLKGDNDILSLTQPALVEEFHRAYIEAGADLVSTNTFNGTRISQADYQTDSSVAELNRAAAEICVRAARWGAAKFQRRIFVAGTLGPTNRTLSMSPDVNRPDYRAVTWDQVVTAYTTPTDLSSYNASTDSNLSLLAATGATCTRSCASWTCRRPLSRTGKPGTLF